MDITVLREVITVVTFFAFVAIVAWAWSGGNRERFDEAANLPLEDTD